METTDYVSYPLALALKKAGFDWPCDHYYSYAKTSKDSHSLIDALPSVWDWNGEYMFEFTHPECSAPTLWQAQKWLREKKSIVINVTPETDMADFNDIPKEFLTGEWCYEIWAGDDTHIYGMVSYSSYEQALSAGIAAALELIEESKTN